MSELAEPVTELVAVPRRDHLLRRLLRHRSSQVGLVLLGFYALLILLGPLLVKGNPTSNVYYQNLGESLLHSSHAHWLGTDQLGRDELVRLILGARYTIFIGIGAVLVGMLIGVPLGGISGFYRGRIDMVIQRFIDVTLAFPHFLLALSLVAALGPGLGNLIIAVALASFPRFVRLIRASVLSVRELPFTDAARMLGVSERRVLWRHVMPNSLTPVIVQAPLELGSAILTASGLGFLGLGVAQPTPEWGTMLGESRNFIFGDSRLVTYPGLAIVGAILAFNLLGDGLRDVLDPRLRSRIRIPKKKAQRPDLTKQIAEEGIVRALLEVHNLSTHFHTSAGLYRAVDGVDLTMYERKTLCVVGESGSGKSVTALSVMGLVDAPGEIQSHSQVLFARRNLLYSSEKQMRSIRGRDITMIFQEPMTSLDPVYPVGYQIAEAIRAHEPVNRKVAMDRAVELMRLVGISSPERRAREYPHQLSGGMRQRVMIAAALSCNPKLLIADEPTTALDVTIQAQILELMKDLRDRLGMAILMITHDLGVVAEMADEVAVMYSGQIVETGSVADIFAHPQHPYTEALLESMPVLGMDKTQPLHVIEGSVPSPLHWPPGCRFAPRCRYVFDRCRTQSPPLMVVGEQKAACWLREGEAAPFMKSEEEIRAHE